MGVKFMSELFKCIIDLPKFPIKKNNKAIFRNRTTGRAFIASNTKAQALMNILNAKLLQEKLRSGIDTIDYDVNVSMQFYFPQSVYFNKQGKRSAKVPDLDNLFAAINDGLQKVGIIKNDSQINGFDNSFRAAIPEGHKLKIVITKKEQV